MIELVVVVAIMAMITGIVIANMKQNEQARSIKSTADSVGSGLRQAQNNVLSGLPHSVSGNPSRAWGVQLASANNRYEVFVEEAGPTNKQIVEQANFLDKVRINALRINGVSVSSLEIRFFPPFGEIRMTGGTHTEAKNLTATITLEYQGTSRQRTITIDGISGRIQIQ